MGNGYWEHEKEPSPPFHVSLSGVLDGVYVSIHCNVSCMSLSFFCMSLAMTLLRNVKKITLTDTKKTAASRNMSCVKPLVKTAAINSASVITIIAIVETLSILLCNIKPPYSDLVITQTV